MVAVEDWISAVTRRPMKKAVTGLFVTLSIAVFRVPEEFSFRESPIRRIPYRNIASPPNSERTSNMLIYLPYRGARRQYKVCVLLLFICLIRPGKTALR